MFSKALLKRNTDMRSIKSLHSTPLFKAFTALLSLCSSSLATVVPITATNAAKLSGSPWKFLVLNINISISRNTATSYAKTLSTSGHSI